MKLCDKSMMLFYFFSPYCTAVQPTQQDTKISGKKLNFVKQIFAMEPISICNVGPKR